METLEALRRILIHGRRADLAQLLERARLVLKRKEPARPSDPGPVAVVALVFAPVEDYLNLLWGGKEIHEEILFGLQDLHDHVATGERITGIRFLIDPDRPTADTAVTLDTDDKPDRDAPSADEELRRLLQALMKDYASHGYLTCDRLFVSGEAGRSRGRGGSGSNAIRVNADSVAIGGAPFLLLFSLAVELKKGQGGWVNWIDLESEKTVSEHGVYQAFSNLRKLLEPYLLDADGRTFIQNDGEKNYRISTHPDFVTYDKERLLLHPNQRVKDLAKTLP